MASKTASRWKTINDYNRNCAVPTTCSNLLLLTRFTGIRTALANASACLWTAYARLGRISGQIVPLGKLHTERLVPVDTEFGASYAFWRCALWPGRIFWPDRKASCSLGGPWGAYAASLKPWLTPPHEPVIGSCHPSPS